MKKLFAVIIAIAILVCFSSCTNKEAEETIDTGETISDGIHFGTVADLLSAIKHDPYNYIGKEIQVYGTLCKFDSDTLLFDRQPTSDSSKNTGVAFRYEAQNSPNIEIIIPDKVLYTVIEDGDYIAVSGTVKISDDKIYLDNCTYSFIS